MSRNIRYIGIIALFLLLVTSCVSGRHPTKSRSSKKASTTNRMGYVLPKYNFSIDAVYNPKVAHIIPGYTAVTVAIVNKGFNGMSLRPDKDRWMVKRRKGGWVKGINEIQYEVPETWAQLDPEMRRLISYPVVVPPGYTQTFEIFFPGEHNLDGFAAIKHYNSNLEKTFTFTRY